MFFRKNDLLWLGIAAVVIEFRGMYDDDLTAIFSGSFAAIAVCVCMRLNMRRRRNVTQHIAECVTDETSMLKGARISRQSSNIAPFITNWSIGSNQIIKHNGYCDNDNEQTLMVDDYPVRTVIFPCEHTELLLPVHDCECTCCENKRKMRYDDVE